MDTGGSAIVSALWLGILTSISPCPLASNIAAITFLSKKIVHPKAVFLRGLAYTAGRMVSYTVLGFILIGSVLSVPVLANFLQKYMNRIIGPLLIFTGLILLEVFRFNLRGFSVSQKHQQSLADWGSAGAFVLGLVFALVFCPISAALFFGSLIPLALSHRSGAGLPLVYGLGTGLPVLLFAFLIALGVRSLSGWFERLTRLEALMRKLTGGVFIVVGLYYVMVYLLKIL